MAIQHPHTIGYYWNNQKTNRWTYLSDTLIEIFDYENDVKNGQYLKLKRTADTTYIRINYATTWQPYEKEITINEKMDTLIVAHYSNNELNGAYQEFDTLARLRVKGNYLNGEKNGSWTTYYPSGEIEYEGTYDLGVRTGRWYYWEADEKGKMKRTRINNEDSSLVL